MFKKRSNFNGLPLFLLRFCKMKEFSKNGVNLQKSTYLFRKLA